MNKIDRNAFDISITMYIHLNDGLSTSDKSKMTFITLFMFTHY